MPALPNARTWHPSDECNRAASISRGSYSIRDARVRQREAAISKGMADIMMNNLKNTTANGTPANNSKIITGLRRTKAK